MSERCTWEYMTTSDRVSFADQGRNGWELVSVIQRFSGMGSYQSADQLTLYWKRPARAALEQTP